MDAFQRATAQTTSPVQNRVRSLVTKALGSVWLEPTLLENVVTAFAAELEQAETTALNALAANAELRATLEQFADGESWEWIDDLPCWEGEGSPWEIAQEALENSTSSKGWDSPYVAAQLKNEITFLRMWLQGCTRLTDAEITDAFATWQPESEQHANEVL